MRKKVLHRAIEIIKAFIGRRFRLKLKNNYTVCKLIFEKAGKVRGRVLDFMGFLFYRMKTIIRKGIMLSATRLAKRMDRAKQEGRGYYLKHVQSMLSYIGWFTCTDTYDCYEEHIKPYVVIKKLKKIVSKMKRRQNHERMVKGKMLREAGGVTACCA